MVDGRDSVAGQSLSATQIQVRLMHAVEVAVTLKDHLSAFIQQWIESRGFLRVAVRAHHVSEVVALHFFEVLNGRRYKARECKTLATYKGSARSCKWLRPSGCQFMRRVD